MNFVKELQWRGMLQDIMPGTEEQLEKEMTSAYIGFDPTADSLHIGHLVGVMLLKHFQIAGHKPHVLVGGATGMIGDPSGKSSERNLLDEESLKRNQEALKKQLKKFLDFESQEVNAAVLVNNYDWMKEFSFLDFIRDVGKHITVNYMMSKDSVKTRLSGENAEGMSFTEFSYQLVQGYDFLHLYRNNNCLLQMGGSDQWGNITTGTELIRRIDGGKGYALTAPLITKADGNKFGKSEGGNVWLDPERTSPYKFYQFWLNTSDEDAAKYIKIFTLKKEEEISELQKEHDATPHLRILQKALAEEITVRVHSLEDYENAVEASQILFGNSTSESLKKLSEDDFLSVFEGVPQAEVKREEIETQMEIVQFLVDVANVFNSYGEARRMVSANGISINKNKVDASKVISTADLLLGKYILVQKGKKNYYLVKVHP